MANKISQVFNNLDLWRHLPAYQLERRADIFFSVYLHEIIEWKFGKKPIGIIPEFPVHIPTIYPKMKQNLSFKIDYFAYVAKDLPPLFIELKTDMSSRREKQDWYLRKAQVAGLTKLLQGLKQIYKATQSKPKYDFLLTQLENFGLIKIQQRGEFNIMVDAKQPKIIYIQPKKIDDNESVISFVEIAEIITDDTDALSRRFKESLIKWDLDPVG